MRAYWRTLPTAGTRAGEQVDRGAAADAVELARLLEVLDERERVDRLADRVEVEHRLEDQAVRLAVEVLRLEALVDDQRRAARCPTAGRRRGPTARPRGSAAAQRAAERGRRRCEPLPWLRSRALIGPSRV